MTTPKQTEELLPTPEMIAAAWQTVHKYFRPQDTFHGNKPHPAFREAIEAAFKVMPRTPDLETLKQAKAGRDFASELRALRASTITGGDALLEDSANYIDILKQRSDLLEEALSLAYNIAYDWYRINGNLISENYRKKVSDLYMRTGRTRAASLQAGGEK